MLNKLRLLLMAAPTATALLVLIWAQPPAQPLIWAQPPAQPAQAAGPEMSLGAMGNVLCDDPSKPGQCAAPFVPGDPKAGEFQLTINANVIPAGGYAHFGAEVFVGGLAYNERPCTEEVVWPDLWFCLKAIGGAGQIQFGPPGCNIVPPCYPLSSTYVGTLVELNVHCPAEGTFKVSLTAAPSSVFGATYFEQFAGLPVLVKPVGQQELDLDGDTVPETVDLADALVITCKNPTADTDNDGCTDLREQGLTAQQGGLRDPANFWDFYDTPDADNVRDKVINLFGDILGVANRFGATGDPGGEPLAGPIPLPPGYHTAFDRSAPPPGGDPWDIGPPDGVITLFDDILGAAQQFGHDCR